MRCKSNGYFDYSKVFTVFFVPNPAFSFKMGVVESMSYAWEGLDDLGIREKTLYRLR